MSEMKPEMEPSEGAGAMTEATETQTPSAIPPQGGGEEIMSSADFAMNLMTDLDAPAPTLPLEEGVAAGVTAWQNNKRITALYSTNNNRNSWVGVGGVGWRKLANNSDSAIVALTMLSAHAREKASRVNYEEGSDGMIRQMYVW